jgi:hypothetical protein
MRAFAPLLAAAAAVLLAALTGFDRRSLSGTVFEDHFYGFFADRYPLFLFAIVYGVAFILAAAAESKPRRWIGLLFAPAAAGGFLLVCFYPTFGGYVLRPGFIVGGVAFLRGAPLWAAYFAGTAAAALVFALALGTASALVRRRFPLGRRSLVAALLNFLALWLGAALLAAPRALGLSVAGRWPALPLDWMQAAATLALVGLALLPHALLAAGRARRQR